LTLAGLILAFFVGFVGLYSLMPMIAPQQVEKAQRQLDSLALTRGLDIGRDPLMMYDSLNGLWSHLDSLVHMGDYVSGALDDQRSLIRSLEDSLEASRARLGVMEREHVEFIGLLDDLMKRLKTLEAQRVDLKNMSKTLSKLEERELSGIVSLMDTEVLKQLYLEGTDRERKSFLAALPSDRAASLVNGLVRPTIQRADFDTDGAAVDSTGANGDAPQRNTSGTPF
jgi:hypothetical protein